MASSTNKGFSLIEVLVAITLLLLILVGSLSANSLASGAVLTTKMRANANLLAKEGLEALQSVRAASFTSLRTGDFHPVLSSGAWTLVSGPETIGQFTRTITLASVMRNIVCTTPICNIASAGGIVDQLSYKATVKVSWKEKDQDKTYQYNTLVTYWR